MLQEKLLRTIKKHAMLSKGDRLVAAVSGGVDSVVMLHLLHSLKETLGIELHVAHLNHGIRGEDADQDALFVEYLGVYLGIHSTICKVDVPALQREWRMGTEEAARQARYRFLEETADRIGADRIATAHTASDQAETLLMNIIRGTGIEGLGGIHPVRGRIIRPLIDVSRSEIEEYAKEHSLSFREDATNVDRAYTRNRIRHDLIPSLREYNLRVDEALSRLAETAREDNSFIETAVSKASAELASGKDDRISFPLPAFQAQPRAIQRRLIRAAVEELLGSTYDLGFVHTENLLASLDDPGVYEVELPAASARLRKTDEGVSVYIVRPETTIQSVPPRLIPVPGEVEIPELGLLVKTEIIVGEVDWRRPRNSMDVVVDADKITGNLTLRTWLPGDRITPLGMTSPKKLQDIFIDRKIQKDKRGTIPVIADEEKIVWVAGVAVSQEVAVTDSTSVFVQLTVA